MANNIPKSSLFFPAARTRNIRFLSFTKLSERLQFILVLLLRFFNSFISFSFSFRSYLIFFLIFHFVRHLFFSLSFLDTISMTFYIAFFFCQSIQNCKKLFFILKYLALFCFSSNIYILFVCNHSFLPISCKVPFFFLREFLKIS